MIIIRIMLNISFLFYYMCVIHMFLINSVFVGQFVSWLLGNM